MRKECYEERDKSKRNFQGGGIRIMDVVADADGNPDQDIRRFPNYEDKQKEGMEIQYDLVLGDRLCCIENQGVLSSFGKESSKGIPDEEDSQEKESGSFWRLMQYDSIAINVIVENKREESIPATFLILMIFRSLMKIIFV